MQNKMEIELSGQLAILFVECRLFDTKKEFLIFNDVLDAKSYCAQRWNVPLAYWDKVDTNSFVHLADETTNFKIVLTDLVKNFRKKLLK